MSLNFYRDCPTDSSLKTEAMAMLDYHRASGEGHRLLRAIVDYVPEEITLEYLQSDTVQEHLRRLQDEDIIHANTFNFFDEITEWGFDEGWSENYVEQVVHDLNEVWIFRDIGVVKPIDPLPEHWQCPPDLDSTLTSEQLGEYKKQVLAKYEDANPADKLDPYIAYTTWHSIAGNDTKIVEEIDPIAATVAALEGDAFTDERDKLVDPRTFNSSMVSTASTTQANNTLSSIDNYTRELQKKYVEYIEKVMLDQANAEANRINKKYSVALRDLGSKLNMVAVKKFDHMVEEIVNDANSKWHVFGPVSESYGLKNCYYAVSKEPIVVNGNDDEDYCMADDEEYCYSHVMVKFNRYRVMGVTLGGLANPLDAVHESIHPHKNNNYDTGFCWGNIGSAVIEALTGNFPKAAGNQQQYSAYQDSNLKLYAKAIMQDMKAGNEERRLLQDYEKYFRITDIRKYLGLVHQILFHVDYDSPYIRLAQAYLDDEIAERVDGMSSDAKYDVFGSSDYECTDGFESTVYDMTDVSVNSSYKKYVTQLYVEGHTDPKHLDTIENYTDTFIPREIKMYQAIREELAKHTTEDVQEDMPVEKKVVIDEDSDEIWGKYEPEGLLPIPEGGLITASTPLTVDTMRAARDRMIANSGVEPRETTTEQTTGEL